MTVLKNAKHEKFAQGLAQGKTADQAYADAGYKQNRKNAARLKANEDIQVRVAELTEKGAEKAEVDVSRVLQELSRIGFSDLRKLFTPGGALLPPEDWPDDAAAAISAVEVVTRPTGETDEDGRKKIEHVHKIRLWDKNSALEKIAKHLGMLVEKHEISHVHSLADEDLETELKVLLGAGRAK